MILRRMGNKSAVAQKIIPLFPAHKTWLEPFFGAGGMFFNKPLAQYNVLNDADEDVSNLFWLLLERPDALRNAIEIMPVHNSLLQFWRKNQGKTPIEKALRFLFLSNYTLYAGGDSLVYGTNQKKILLDNFDEIFNKLKFCDFLNVSFDKFFRVLQKRDKKDAFCYCDPPYLGAGNNYATQWSENDSIDLFRVCVDSGIKFAISEFDNPIIMELAKSHNLNCIEIGERVNLKNRRMEMLFTNYEIPQLTLF